MKFLNILKEYNNAIIKENKRLKSIYNTLLRESEDDLECVDETDDDVLNDCVISEKDDVESKECDDSGCNESEFDEMLEASKKDSSAEDDADNVDENDLMLASEFFRECDGS